MRKDICCIGLLLLVLAIFVTHERRLTEPNNQVIAEIALSLKPAMSFREVVSKIRREVPLGESIVRDFYLLTDGERSLELSSPARFGAQNWRLTVEFSSARLVHWRIRSADTESMKPESAPPDVGGGQASKE